LPRDSFLRIHRSYIVALSKIESYNQEVMVVAKKELPISRMYKHEVSKMF
jgi:DNA-binding LytR/AlgR family response regulator